MTNVYRLRPKLRNYIGRKHRIPGLPAAVLYDNFTSVTDGVSLASRVPPVRPNLNTWTIGSGTWLGNAQRVEANFATTTAGALVFDTGKTDIDIRVRFRFSAGGTNRNAAIAFRYQNTTNTWYAGCKIDGGIYQLVNLASNVHNVIATGSYPFVVNTDYTMRVVTQGDNISVTVEGVGALTTTSAIRNTMTSHGLRASNTAAGGSIFFDDFIALDVNPPADIILTVNSSPLLTSNYQTGISHVVGADLFNGNATSKARGMANLATAFHFHRVSCGDGFGTVGPWTWNGTGTRPAEPNSWTSLDSNMNNVLSMGGTPVIGFGNWPWFLRGNWNGTTTVDVTLADQFHETVGRPYTERLSDILLLVQRAVERYAIAPYNCRYWQLGQWEFHGFFVGRDGTFNSLAYDNLPGGANQASMGMAYLHNQVAARIVSTMTTLGIARSSYKIITNYPPTRSYGSTSSSQWYPVGHPLRGQVWGNADKRFVDALISHVALLDPTLYDIWSWDMNSGAFDDVNLADDWATQQKMTDFAAYFISQIGLTKPCWVSEYYVKPVNSPGTGNAPYRAAILADGHIRMIVQGVSSALIWSPAGRGNEPQVSPTDGTNPDAALITPVSPNTNTTGGVTTPMFDVIKVLNDYFSVGTPIYGYTIVSGTGISAIFSNVKGYLVNHAATTVTVSLEGVVYSLGAYECKVIDLNRPVQLIWHEDHEINDPVPLYGRLSQWYLPYNGATSPSPDDDDAETGASTLRPSDGAATNLHHSGLWSMKTTISVTATAKAGCRTNYRPLLANNQLGDYYYGAWYYLPNMITVGNFWQHMQWKVRDTNTSTAPYVAYAIYVYNPAPGQMAYRLTYKLGEDAAIPGPQAGGGIVAFSEDNPTLIPVATWYHLEAYFKPSVYPNYNGRIIVRLNGVQIFDWNNIVTLDQSAARYNAWHVTNYGRQLKLGNTIGDGVASVQMHNDDETIGQNGWIYGSAVQPW